jgi:hypothetical protein
MSPLEMRRQTEGLYRLWNASLGSRSAPLETLRGLDCCGAPPRTRQQGHLIQKFRLPTIFQPVMAQGGHELLVQSRASCAGRV